MDNLTALNKISSGWSEASSCGMLVNPNIYGAIIDNEILSGEWFVIFNDERESLFGFESREDAIEAFVSASVVDNAL